MKKTKIAILVIATIVVGFLTWLMIRVITMEEELTVRTVYSLPEGNELTGITGFTDGDYSVAVDGIIADRNGDTIRPTASTAKMITALAIMKARPFDLGSVGETIIIDEEAYDKYAWYLNNNGSNTAVQIGEEISEYDALASMLMASSNNMADTMAIWAFGSLEQYREYATNMLNEMGIYSTIIGDDASGYSSTTTSTASDLAKIGYELMQEPVLRQIVGLKNHEVPVAGLLTNTNKLLGLNNINGIKTGYIGDASGYCLISGYEIGTHEITIALLGATTRNDSFDESLGIVQKLQSLIPEQAIINTNDVVAYYDSWWQKSVPIKAEEAVDVINWKSAEKDVSLSMNNTDGELRISIGNSSYIAKLRADEYSNKPSLIQKIMHAFGWSYSDNDTSSENETSKIEPDDTTKEEVEHVKTEAEILAEENAKLTAITGIPTDNYTVNFGYLMLINPNFPVDIDFIDARRGELVSISELYGIIEGNPYNGDNLLDPEAAVHINDMVRAYETDYPGHTLETRSCYRARGTTCGRLCAATGTSDHHTGLTCDLLDPVYGTSLDTDTYDRHIEWQWLYANSYKYGFIDRFPYEWAGGPMSEPANVDENGSTGLFETWHYRFVGVKPATEIATGKYNNGNYDSLEHYLKARGLIGDLRNGN